MKKTFILAIALLAAGALHAQIIYSVPSGKGNTGPAWFDFQLSQQFGLGEWSEQAFVADRLPRTSLTELRAVFNWQFARPVGFFADMGLGIMPAPREGGFDVMDFPVPDQSRRYFAKDKIDSRLTRSASAHYKMTFGLFGDIPSGRVSVMPYAGVGFMTFQAPYYECMIKEQGSNMQYRARYEWFSDEEAGQPSTLGYLTGRLVVGFPLSDRAKLLCGLEYTWFFPAAKFSETCTNSFNENIVKTYRNDGKCLNMLGLNIGISFR